MDTELLVRYLHFVGVFVMFALLTSQHTALKGSISAHQLKRLTIIDTCFGVSALMTLLCGVGLWFWVGKPAGFYSHNWVFHIKITLFVVAGLISFIPTVFLVKSKRTQQDVTEVPKCVVMALRLELLILLVIPLFAVLMANGVGYTQ